MFSFIQCLMWWCLIHYYSRLFSNEMLCGCYQFLLKKRNGFFFSIFMILILSVCYYSHRSYLNSINLLLLFQIVFQPQKTCSWCCKVVFRSVKWIKKWSLISCLFTKETIKGNQHSRILFRRSTNSLLNSYANKSLTRPHLNFFCLICI